MGVLFVMAIGIGTYDVNKIRIGGTLHAHEQAAAGLLADSTPPSATAAAPYLVATRVVHAVGTGHRLSRGGPRCACRC
jgi:hypothetical protein